MRLVITNGGKVNKLFKPVSCFDVSQKTGACMAAIVHLKTTNTNLTHLENRFRVLK
ncbi:Uncharacterized protein APZ42_008144 [Daphnia magna]|uniref:Uncharacterized protein n=1 Tax=Daphnia magna TaxID=35525 RepID=A0A164EUN1_9CRUS|nr:Uncharacterized protein APZ42_008144 [Daphnia magna]